jgi:hypothetical protein
MTIAERRAAAEQADEPDVDAEAPVLTKES